METSVDDEARRFSPSGSCRTAGGAGRDVLVRALDDVIVEL